MVTSTNLNIIVSIETRSNDVALFWLDSIIRSYHLSRDLGSFSHRCCVWQGIENDISLTVLY